MTEKAFLRYHQFQKICSKYSKEIIHIANLSWKNIDFSLDEPKIIRQYLDKGIDILNNNLTHIWKQYGFIVKFSSVYIHQKPKITRLNGDQCELGDLLIIFSFMDRNKIIIVNRALIIQAKKLKKIIDDCQQKLYEIDPYFYFPKNLYQFSVCSQKPERYWPIYWDNRTKALKYLILDKFRNPFFVFLPWDLSIKASWAIIFLWILIGNTSLRFSRSPYTCQNWSAIIWDLITVTGRSTIRGKSRGKNINYLREFVENFNDFNDYRNSKIISDNEGTGIPILLIIVQDQEIII